MIPDTSTMVRDSLAAYAAMQPGYRVARHHRLIAGYLEAVAFGRIDRLMIYAPPRHGKSQLASGFFPAWYMGGHPNSQVIFATYGATYASDWGRKVRALTRDPIYRQAWNTTVVSESKAAHRFHLTNGSMYVSTGTEGVLTGRGANLLVIDDPVKNSTEAESPRVQQRTIDWYDSTASTRLMPGAGIVLIMTRWHERDLAGYITASEPHRWVTLRLPAEADDVDDPLGRALGEPLWPEWYPTESFSQHRTKRWWSPLYQQRPVPASGGLLKASWWKRYQSEPQSYDSVVASWDLAFKGGAASDWVVGQVWGRVGGDFFLLDQVRERADFPRTCVLIDGIMTRYDGHRLPRIDACLVEDKANGPAVMSTLRGRYPRLLAVEPDGGKIARANAVSAIIEEGHVFVPDFAAYVEGFISECSSFPLGEHDDQVDAMTQALSYMAQNSGISMDDLIGISALLPKSRWI